MVDKVTATPRYFLDQANLAGEADTFSDGEFTESGVIGLHYDNLFDQLGDESGQIIDLATGVIMGSETAALGYTGMNIVELETDSNITDISALDDADRWLLRHAKATSQKLCNGYSPSKKNLRKSAS